MDCSKILELFQSELVVVHVGPNSVANALIRQGYQAVQVDWTPVAGGDKEAQALIELLGM